jgi:sugar phosphate isomerase/epimerase
MKIGAVSLGWGDTPLPKVFTELKTLGGECIEINGRPGLHDGLILNSETAPQVLVWAQAAGLKITSLSGYCDFAQSTPKAMATEIERLLSSCRVAPLLGASIVRAFVGEPKPGHTFAEFRPQIVEAFKEAADKTAPLGVTLAIENHGLLVNDGPTLAQLVEEIDKPNLGLTLDTGNFCWAGRTLAQAQQDFAAALPHTVSVHIKDGLWQNGKFEFVPSGDGQLDIEALLAQLAARGYQGAICSEYEGAGEFLAGTRRSVEHLKAARQRAIKTM